MKLQVKQLDKKDAGTNIAATSKNNIEQLNCDEGDHVLVHGNSGYSVVELWDGYDRDSGDGYIRIDGETRKRVGANIDSYVDIENVTLKPASEIFVQLPRELNITGNIESLISKQLTGRGVIPDSVVSISVGLGVLGNSDNKIKIKILDGELSTGGSSIFSSGGNSVDESDVDGFIIKSNTDITIKSKPQTSKEKDSQTNTQNTTNTQSRQKTDGDEFNASTVDETDTTYEDIGGLNDEISSIREMIELPLSYPELFNRLGVEPPSGVLLHGPPGTGKTLLAKAVATETNAEFFNISAPEIMNAKYGEAEKRLREIFGEAGEKSPSIIFIDEIDGIASDRGDGDDFENRIVAQLLTLMDGLGADEDIVVIAATNRADSLDDALRRGGRFDREIEIGVPDRDEREEIIQVYTRDVPLAADVNITSIAERAHGFVGADIDTLMKESAMNALGDIRSDIDFNSDSIDANVLQQLKIEKCHIDSAFEDVTPSAMREVFAEVPDVSWDDVGGLSDSKEMLQECVQWPLEHTNVFDDYGVEPASGILLYGPPGTGKTLLAKAVANESDVNFISVKGPELMNKYIGESEESVREIFEKARSNAPSIIFFDELDAIAGERNGGGGDGGVGDRVVTQLLTEIDGLEGLENVTVIGTTNRPDQLDDALLRPGRLEEKVNIGVPDEEARRDIINVHIDNKPTSDVSISPIVEATEGFVGADIESAVREATMKKVRTKIRNNETESIESLTTDDIIDSVKNTEPTVDDEMLRKYDLE